jgi:hypothetical protein
MDHLEFAAAEAAGLEPTDWDWWIEAAEKLAGHHLDGDQATDGYSLDFAYAAWKRGQTPQAYVDSIVRPVSPPVSQGWTNQQRQFRLSQLGDNLNLRYNAALAKLHEASPRASLGDGPAPCLVVSRGTTPEDVIVAVSISDDGVYVIAAFTSAGWFEYGDPFVTAERDAIQRAAAWILHFIPETPTT